MLDPRHLSQLWFSATTFAVVLTAGAGESLAQSGSPADTQASPPPTGGEASPKQDDALPFIGAGVDLGIPDGAMAGLVGRPLPWLRVAAAAGTNSIGFGLRGGVTVVPFRVGPSATVEVGHYFDGNANRLVSTFADASYEGNRMAERIGYEFANLHLGGELGERRFTFFLHGGMSYLHTTLHDVNALLGGSTKDGTTTVDVTSDPIVTAWLPTFKLGLIVYLL